MHVRVLGLQIDPTSGSSIVLLGERESMTRVLPIFIGPAEAQSIAIALQGIEVPRPMTHDLCISTLAAVGAHITEVAITELRDQTFIAEVRLDTAVGTHHVDARPSDGIALALRVEAPVTVDDEVFDIASVAFTYDADRGLDSDEIERIVNEFRSFLATTSPEDFAEEPGRTDEPRPPDSDSDN